MLQGRKKLESVIVTAEEMRQIESRIFTAGMPVAALMEKAATLCVNRIQQLYPLEKVSTVGILVGPGHNGGDALVIARELYLQGYKIIVYSPFANLKDLTANQVQYVQSLRIPCYDQIESLQSCDLIVDGLFGFGLTRSLSGDIANAIEKINSWKKTVISIDIPSGLQTDTGEVLGIAIKATHSFCLGLWKRAYFQDQALAYLGEVERLDFGIPPQDVWAILSNSPSIQTVTKTLVKQVLPLPRPLVTHKYQQGHLLLICGSYRYAGSAILTGLGARASGVGMLSIAVPKSLKPILINHLPEALIIECPETANGAIAAIPQLIIEDNKYNIIACGPGLTLEAQKVIKTVLAASCPLILDADALNILAELGISQNLSQRRFTTVLTPHLGEFRRLFPEINPANGDRISLVQQAAQQSGAIILLKGARTAIATPQGAVWLIKDSTPGLARGGSGDVLTGLIGGLMAQLSASEGLFGSLVATAAWWHAQAGILAAKKHTELGIDPLTLTDYCNLLLENFLNSQSD